MHRRWPGHRACHRGGHIGLGEDPNEIRSLRLPHRGQVVSTPTAIVIGVGAQRGLAAAICRRSAAERYHVFVAGRTTEKIEHVVRTIVETGGSAEPVPTDATREAEVVRLFDRAMSSGGDREAADIVVFNAGNNRRGEFPENSSEPFEEFWPVGCFGGFFFALAAALRTLPLRSGTLVV